MILVSSCSCLCPIHWSQVLSRWCRCSWSSADRRCSNYIWVIDNFIANLGASYIRDLTVHGIHIQSISPDVSTMVNACRPLAVLHNVLAMPKYLVPHSISEFTGIVDVHCPTISNFNYQFTIRPWLMYGAVYGSSSNFILNRIQHYNSPASQRFSPSSEQPEHRILAHGV